MKFKIALIYLLLFNLIYFNFSYSLENKIVVKLNNEIITNIDVVNEENFLKILNPNLNSFNKTENFEIAKKSLINEMIKEIELKKIYKQLDIEDSYYRKFIEANYLRYGFKDIDDFHIKMNESNISLEKLRKKISIEAIWNQLIFAKYSSKIKIDKEEIKNIILNKENKKKNSYLLSEIVYRANETSEKKIKFQQIKKSIIEDGFYNTAIKYSISQSSKIGGKIGWITEDSLNQNLKDIILKLNTGSHTDPIQIPGGYLILLIEDKKEIVEKVDFDKEFENLIKNKTNQQLNQFSSIYFQKIKKDIFINEI